MDFIGQIKENNKTHVVNEEELKELVKQANSVFKQNFDNKVWFERSVFINWSCAIADCKYCYLSTKPKSDLNAVRHPASIIAEAIICKQLGWKVGYITGGLRVESNQYLAELAKKLNIALGEKIMMNFGPYNNDEIEVFKPYISGMGCAVESFDEELHRFICPSKPLKALLKFLENLEKNNLKKMVTIILGLGEKKEDVEIVIENIKKYGINKVQLCFLKPQDYTIFKDVPSPDPNYMTWWISKIRLANPNVQINVALVRDRISDLSLYLEAGANSFTRFFVFDDFASELAIELEQECKKAGRELQGQFTNLPDLDLKKEIGKLEFDDVWKEKILAKAEMYYTKLKKKKSSKINKF